MHLRRLICLNLLTFQQQKLLQYSLEGHQFAVFGFVLTNDLRYMVSISTRFVTWDLSTSDLQRDVNPGIEGIMQQLILSPDNKWAAAYSNNNQTVLLNMLSSEFVIIDNPFNDGESVTGVFLLNQWFVYLDVHLCMDLLHAKKNTQQLISIFIQFICEQ